jgi:hypothetical protein
MQPVAMCIIVQMQEVVKYVLLRDTTILTEYRTPDAGHPDAATLIPGGGIEEVDKLTGKDYREVALLREISEELQGDVTVASYHYLGEFEIKERNFIFYIYLITDWQGSIPEYIMENGKKDGKLAWIEKDLLIEQSDNRVNRYIIEKVNEYLQK